MPHYTFKHKETGEVRQELLRISELDQFKSDNPDWETVIHPSNFISGAKSPMRMAGKEWENHLSAIKKGSGKDNTIKV